jgi:CRP-like cAMP-binding protein
MKEALRSVGIFAGLSDSLLEQIAGVAHEEEFPAGHVLIESGMAGTGMFVLLDGRVSVHARGIDTELGPGEVIGEVALLRNDSRRIARVQALTPVRCLAIGRSDFRELVTKDADLAVALLENVADRIPD